MRDFALKGLIVIRQDAVTGVANDKFLNRRFLNQNLSVTELNLTNKLATLHCQLPALPHITMRCSVWQCAIMYSNALQCKAPRSLYGVFLLLHVFDYFKMFVDFPGGQYQKSLRGRASSSIISPSAFNQSKRLFFTQICNKAIYFSVKQQVAVCSIALLCITMRYNVQQCAAVYSKDLQCIATRYRIWQCTAWYKNAMQYNEVH